MYSMSEAASIVFPGVVAFIDRGIERLRLAGPNKAILQISRSRRKQIIVSFWRRRLRLSRRVRMEWTRSIAGSGPHAVCGPHTAFCAAEDIRGEAACLSDCPSIRNSIKNLNCTLVSKPRAKAAHCSHLKNGPTASVSIITPLGVTTGSRILRLRYYEQTVKPRFPPDVGCRTPFTQQRSEGSWS
jgi:hypothetical protein